MKRVILEEQLPGFRSIEKHLTPVGIRRLNYRVNDIPALFCFFSLADVDNQIFSKFFRSLANAFYFDINYIEFQESVPECHTFFDFAA